MNTSNTSSINIAYTLESLSKLRFELQEYNNNASKGGVYRQRNMAMLAEDIARLEALVKDNETAKAKTMQDLESQAMRLTERAYKRVNRAYLNAAAKHLTEKAKAIDVFLNVRPIHEAFCVALEYSSPFVGMALKIASPFCVEAFLNNPEQVLKVISA